MESIAHFAEATRISPGYLEAHVQLGLLRAQDGEPTLALQSFLKALELEPEADYLQFNVALILVTLHRPADAEVYARLAARHQPLFVDAYYVLGASLVMQDNLSEETVAALHLASDKYPQAHDMLMWVEQERSRFNLPSK
jgi:tetratricopeptide (TPR) repeat protein